MAYLANWFFVMTKIFKYWHSNNSLNYYLRIPKTIPNAQKYFCHYPHSILMNHQQLIDTIMDNDKDIRFATICNMVGDIEVTGQSEGIEKFLTTE